MYDDPGANWSHGRFSCANTPADDREHETEQCAGSENERNGEERSMLTQPGQNLHTDPNIS